MTTSNPIYRTPVNRAISRIFQRFYRMRYQLMPFRKLLWDVLQASDIHRSTKVLNIRGISNHFSAFFSEKTLKPLNIHMSEIWAYELFEGSSSLLFPYETSSFDTIICLDAFDLFEDRSKLFKEMSRILKHDGTLVMSYSKPNLKVIPIIKDQLVRIKNIYGLKRKTYAIIKSIILIPLSILNLTKRSKSLINKKSQSVEKIDIASYLYASGFSGVNIRYACADQVYLLHAANDSIDQSQERILSPFIFKMAETEEELTAMYSFRYKIFCEQRGYLDALDGQSLESDDYDRNSVHFIAINEKGEIVGTIRLIKNSRIGLPVEKYFGIDLRDRTTDVSSCVEISRLSVLSSKNSINNPIAFGLYKACYDYCTEHRLLNWYAILDKKINRLFNYYGYTFKQIGETRECLGDSTAPFLMNLDDMMKNLNKKRSTIFDFLSHPFPGTFNEFISDRDNRTASN